MIQSALRFVLERAGIVRRSRYRLRYSQTQPDLETLNAKTIIIVGTPGTPKWAVFRCPGTCSTVYRLPLSAAQTPHWRVELDWLGRPSLSPSIFQKSACHAHFWIQSGTVQQCRDSRCATSPAR